jgi:Holliday junction resolvasome RuvABC endonuclease subunit
MIMRIFNIGEIPKPDDAADAIAIAACHALAQR